MSYSQTKTVKVSDITHKHLARLGRKGESYDLIITRLIKEHLSYAMIEDINKIAELCGNTIVLVKNDGGSAQRVLPLEDEISTIREIFDLIVEIVSDEDFVGSAVAFGERDLTLSEVAINVYCMYLEMPSPTFGNGALINPLTPH